MQTILFDIDGTLIQSGGAGQIAMQQAMRELFEIESLPAVDVHGRTDHWIFHQLFSAVQLDYNQHASCFNHRYWENLAKTMPLLEGQILPGVSETLAHLTTKTGIALGLLTGNAQPAATIKLEYFQLDSYFKFGGYGDADLERAAVARLAWQSAREHLHDQFDASNVWVIGDTIHDIACARAIGSRVIAVETGGASRNQLEMAQPDAILPTLNLEQLLEILGSTSQT